MGGSDDDAFAKSIWSYMGLLSSEGDKDSKSSSWNPMSSMRNIRLFGLFGFLCVMGFYNYMKRSVRAQSTAGLDMHKRLQEMQRRKGRIYVCV
jgi:hypothetical protein